jgi:beta-galactosidase
LEASIYPCNFRDITFAMHSGEIQFKEGYTLNLDHRQSGLGGTNSWGELALPQYRMPAGRSYESSFLMTFGETPVPPKRSQPPMLPRKLPTNPPAAPPVK